MTDVYYVHDEPVYGEATALDRDALYGDAPVYDAGAGSGVGRLQKFLDAHGDIAGDLTEDEIATIAADAVADWRRDLEANSDWRAKVTKALDAAAQENVEDATDPWPGAANVRYPLLTVAGLQFAARAYPAIVKGDEAIQVRTFGQDPDGRKRARAKRLKDYLNYMLFYVVDDWEGDTDAMLNQLPAAGLAFRKVYWDPQLGKPCVEFISPLRLTVPPDARSLKTSPRITHDFDRHPYEIAQMQAAGWWRDVELAPEGEDDQAIRVLIEQHRMIDLDKDGLDEPYIVTVDVASQQLLRIEPAYIEDDVSVDLESGYVRAIERWVPYVKYPFMRDPKGRFYDIGFGHLLTPIMRVINTSLNQLLNAGYAQIAGGGFVGSELRLQTAGKATGRLTFMPGEYKTVNATGAELRSSIYERTFPEPSPVLFQLLGTLLDAAKDIASVNDSITGDAARTAPVGTTLALIEQGQQVFNAIYKRIFRAGREEYRLFAEVIARYGDPSNYAEFTDMEAEQPAPPTTGVLAQPMPQGQPGALAAAAPMSAQPMDPVALFRSDFEDDDLDIAPVSDPSAVTRMQAMAKAQFILGLVPTGEVNPKVAVARALEAGAVEDIDDLMTLPPPPGPPPGLLEKLAAELEKLSAQSAKDRAQAQLTLAQAAETAGIASSGLHEAEASAAQARAQAARMDAFANLAGLNMGASNVAA